MGFTENWVFGSTHLYINHVGVFDTYPNRKEINPKRTSLDVKNFGHQDYIKKPCKAPLIHVQKDVDVIMDVCINNFQYLVCI